MSEMHEKSCRVLNFIDYSFIAISTVTGCVFISAFSSLVDIPIGITSSQLDYNLCNNHRNKKEKTIITKKKKNHDKIALLAKSKLNSIEVLISKALIDSNISHDECVLINNVLKGFYDMKEELKNSNK